MHSLDKQVDKIRPSAVIPSAVIFKLGAAQSCYRALRRSNEGRWISEQTALATR